MGSGNPVAGFRWTIGGFWSTLVDNQAQGKGIESVSFNFDPLDSLARGLHSAGVSIQPSLRLPPHIGFHKAVAPAVVTLCLKCLCDH